MAVPLDPRVQWHAEIPPTAPIVGPNERCIELPLGLDVLRCHAPGRALDAGCALNGYIPEQGVQADIWHLTQHIASERMFIPVDRQIHRSYVSADLRDLSLFSDRAFDRTVCVSTLEHVGLDNTGYGGAAETCPETAVEGFRELLRVTARTLFVTVPFSAPPMSCAQWRFFGPSSVSQLSREVAKAGWPIPDLRFYAKTAGGWYGGGPNPVAASPHGFPQAVNAIVCLRCDR